MNGTLSTSLPIQTTPATSRPALFGSEFRLLAAVIAATLTASPSLRADESPDVPRWTIGDGRGFQAKFLRLQGESVVFVKDATEFTVPFSTLSPASLELARRLAAQEPAPHSGNPAAPVDFGPLILTFCTESLGKKIGDGECSALAAAALKKAGAAARGGEDTPNRGDYVWGALAALIEGGPHGAKGVEGLAQVKVGDVIQFRDTRFQGRSPTGKGTYWLEARHHTAVVETVDPVLGFIGILHQNWNGKKLVRRDTLRLGELAKGWLRVYHPIPQPAK